MNGFAGIMKTELDLIVRFLAFLIFVAFLKNRNAKRKTQQHMHTQQTHIHATIDKHTGGRRSLSFPLRYYQQYVSGLLSSRALSLCSLD
jgi:hypothetical protein